MNEIEYPHCKGKRRDCNNIIRGYRCTALTETDIECPFYKSTYDTTVGDLIRYHRREKNESNTEKN